MSRRFLVVILFVALLAPQLAHARIRYRNQHYGFCVLLPDSWKGYTILSEEWHGSTQETGDDGSLRGPFLSIRHPKWTKQDPWQDIPIMVFTRAQRQDVQDEKFFVSPAPVGPMELGRNMEYVFALPPRYNSAFPTGYEEVEALLKRRDVFTARCDTGRGQ